jgi:hypothetical protein
MAHPNWAIISTTNLSLWMSLTRINQIREGKIKGKKRKQEKSRIRHEEKGN